jgi:hypothetical protein
MLKEGGTNREGGQIGKWERQGGGETGRGDRRGKTERGLRQGINREGGQTGRKGGQTQGRWVHSLLFVGPSLSVGTRCPRALVVRGWGVVVVRSRSRIVVVGARSALWFEGGCGGGTVVVALWYRAVVVVVASGCCCSWAAVPVRPRWVVVCWCRAVVVGGWGMVVLGWGMIVRGWGMVVVVGWCGSGVGVVLSVVVGPVVTFVRHYRRCLSSRPTPVALLRGAVVVVVVRVVVRR